MHTHTHIYIQPALADLLIMSAESELRKDLLGSNDDDDTEDQERSVGKKAKSRVSNIAPDSAASKRYVCMHACICLSRHV